MFLLNMSKMFTDNCFISVIINIIKFVYSYIFYCPQKLKTQSDDYYLYIIIYTEWLLHMPHATFTVQLRTCFLSTPPLSSIK